MPTREGLTRRGFFKGCGLAASASWLAGPAPSETRAAPETRPGSHRILTCNIRLPLETDDKAGNGWASRKEMCADIILGQRPDIICIQECLGMQLEYLKARWSGFDSFGLANPDAVFNPMNAIVFSRRRYTVISAGGFWLSQTPHVAGSKSWDSARTRFVNWVHLRTRDSGCEFRVWNTHLDHLGQTAREQQVQLIVQAAEPFPGETPQLFTGDFNANASNPAVQLVKERGWVDTYAAVHGPGDPGFTFHAFRGPEYDNKASKERIRGKIDWIFCRGAVRVSAAEIIREGREGRYPSDHYFVSADVTL